MEAKELGGGKGTWMAVKFILLFIEGELRPPLTIKWPNCQHLPLVCRWREWTVCALISDHPLRLCPWSHLPHLPTNMAPVAVPSLPCVFVFGPLLSHSISKPKHCNIPFLKKQTQNTAISPFLKSKPSLTRTLLQLLLAHQLHVSAGFGEGIV